MPAHPCALDTGFRAGMTKLGWSLCLTETNTSSGFFIFSTSPFCYQQSNYFPSINDGNYTELYRYF